MKFQMTQDQIERGQRQATDRCPVALCIVESLNEAYPDVPHYAAVGPAMVRAWSAKGFVIETGTPDNVRRFIAHYDSGHTMTPLQFEIPLREEKR